MSHTDLMFLCVSCWVHPPSFPLLLLLLSILPPPSLPRPCGRPLRTLRAPRRQCAPRIRPQWPQCISGAVHPRESVRPLLWNCAIIKYKFRLCFFHALIWRIFTSKLFLLIPNQKIRLQSCCRVACRRRRSGTVTKVIIKHGWRM